MSNRKQMEEGLFLVDFIEPTKEQIESYYVKNKEMKSGNGPKTYKKAVILHTSDETKYPVGSTWMIGETPGNIINFFGEKFIEIQTRDLHARID